MATISVKNGELVKAPDALENTIVLTGKNIAPSMLVFIEVVSTAAGIYFSSGEAIDISKHRPWPAGGKFPITIDNGRLDLHFQAGALNESFVVTW